jgi:exopolyphosphatase/guanosine-5'-triphosphate,3'-diphosphate pyrophosphatase
LPSAERAKLRGISHPRGRQILAGAVVADLTMATLDIDSLEICPWALREGIVLRHLGSIAQEAPFSLQPVHSTADADATVMTLRPSQ